MKKRIAINGFGRIGRLTYRALRNRPDVEVVAINDLTDNPTLAHLLKYDTAHRKMNAIISAGENYIEVDGYKILAFAIKDPLALPWKDLDIDIVLECTGIYLTSEAAGAHLKAGAKKVILSAPPKDDSIPTFVFGVNDHELTAEHNILSNASCTTNCFAPIVKILNETWGLQFANMNTIHAYTQDQRLQDAPHKDLRRARAAALNVIPTSTGANKAVSEVYPPIKGKLFGSSYRVPVITGSMIEVFCSFEKNTTADEINKKFKELAEGPLKGILEYTTDPLVSSDIIGNNHSAIFDSELTECKGNLAKIVAWYDNENGYSNRLADMCVKLASLI
jgi:glyceraldehyde 3-phosphate dehydrogenase